MIILALDPGTSCGWAVGQDDKIQASGTWWLAPGRGESPGMRYIRLRGKLNEIQAAYCIDLVVFEMAHHRGGAATRIGAGFVAHIESWCAENKIEHPPGIHSGMIKKWALNKGNANKDEMVAAGQRKFALSDPAARTDDEYDALWLLDYAMGQRWDTGTKPQAPFAAHEGGC